MSKRILVIDGHPDPAAERYLHALAGAYCDGARSSGHEVRSLAVSELQFPLLRTNADFQTGTPTDAIRKCQQELLRAEHLVLLFPLWLGSMPALLKGLLEQVLRPGFAFEAGAARGLPRRLLTGRSARVIVTMGMPAAIYRWYFRAHGLQNLRRSILGFAGFHPVRASLIGRVEAMPPARRNAWLAEVRTLGERAR